VDLRLESMPFVFEGRTYQLRCNMNVLADVQEMNGGAISPALNGKRGQKSALQFLAAMMNDYADEQGWFDPDPETGAPILAKSFTPRALGRVLSVYDVPSAEILGLVTRALTAARGAKDAKSGPEPADAGN
jgi:hypothetical protein